MSKTPVKDSDKDAIIEELKRELENDNKIIDELHNEIDILKNNNNDLKNSYEKLKKEFDEYKVRHPANIGIKNGKAYEYKAEIKNESSYHITLYNGDLS